MTMRRTPYLRIRYPWTSDVVNQADLLAEASDIDAALVSTDTLRTNFARMSSAAVARTGAAVSVAKNTLTTITFDTTDFDNGANSPVANGLWFAIGSPTRLTAPVGCVVLATGFCGISAGSALGANGYWEVAVTLNGGTGQPGYQGTKFNPTSASTGQFWAQVNTLWKLVAGDFLELKVRWNGTPAGPLNTDTALLPNLTVSMLALTPAP